jgi:hypothetical protein
MGKKQRYFPQGKSLSSLNLKKRWKWKLLVNI